MENKQMKCVKGESCLYCGSNYCRFVDELNQLKVENEELKHQIEDVDTLCSEKESLIDKYLQALTEIKELLLATSTDSQEHCVNVKSVILQKISEVLT